MSTVPTEFPTGGTLDLAAVTRAQILASAAINSAAVVVLRAKYGAALAETSREGQAIAALLKAVAAAELLLPFLV